MFVSGRSLVWSGRRLPKPATRVQIPATAPKPVLFVFMFSEKKTVFNNELLLVSYYEV
jgi:hypothetical protein